MRSILDSVQNIIQPWHPMIGVAPPTAGSVIIATEVESFKEGRAIASLLVLLNDKNELASLQQKKALSAILREHGYTETSNNGKKSIKITLFADGIPAMHHALTDVRTTLGIETADQEMATFRQLCENKNHTLIVHPRTSADVVFCNTLQEVVASAKDYYDAVLRQKSAAPVKINPPIPDNAISDVKIVTPKTRPAKAARVKAPKLPKEPPPLVTSSVISAAQPYTPLKPVAKEGMERLRQLAETTSPKASYAAFLLQTVERLSAQLEAENNNVRQVGEVLLTHDTITRAADALDIAKNYLGSEQLYTEFKRAAEKDGSRVRTRKEKTHIAVSSPMQQVLKHNHSRDHLMRLGADNLGLSFLVACASYEPVNSVTEHAHALIAELGGIDFADSRDYLPVSNQHAELGNILRRVSAAQAETK